jgi:peptide/nickel transport system substrate-binding protein
MLKAAGAADLKLNYVVNAGDEVDERLPFCCNSSWRKPG